MSQRFDPVPRYDIAKIVQYLGGEVPATRRGGWVKMACFLHDDKSPSATINFDLNRYWCWSCGCNEDGVGLIGECEGTDFAASRATAQGITGQGDEDIPERAARSTTFGLFD